MKHGLAGAGPGPRPTLRGDTRGGWAPLLGLTLALAILAAPWAGAQEAQPAAPERDSEPRAASSDTSAEPEPAPAPEPPTTSGIEEIVVFGQESEAAGEMQAGGSVTGFGAEDLAALGAQDISDLASFTPNLEIVTAGATTPTFFIRGVGLNDFNANSTGSVAIYRDDVAINAPALQLGALFDTETVTVLRGPQGTGPARNASAGAIKMYSRKPTGGFGGFLRSDLGNFDSRDFEGAVEAPIFGDLLAGRFAFRFAERDGTMKNRCGDALPYADRVPVPSNIIAQGKTPRDPPWSQCGEKVVKGFLDPYTIPGKSVIPDGLPSRVNDIGNWAARGTLLVQPTLDMSWLLSAHGARRDEWSRLGQSYGTYGDYCEDGDVEHCVSTNNAYEGTCIAPQQSVGKSCNSDNVCDYPNQTYNNGVCFQPDSTIENLLGANQGRGTAIQAGYQAPEVRERLLELAPCLAPVPGRPEGTCKAPAPGQPPFTDEEKLERLRSWDTAKRTVAKELAQGLDSEPWAGDFNMCSSKYDVDGDPTNGIQCDEDTGRTRQDAWGAYLKGDIVLPWAMQLTSVTGYDTYDRLIDIDLDFSPETLFQIRTTDSGWQAVQDLRLQGQLGDESWLRWDVGGWFLREQLDVDVVNDLAFNPGSTGERIYTQDLFSAAGYLTLAFDFWDHFTLDGGFRYNWEQKKLDYVLVHKTLGPRPVKLDDTWQAPTGTIRLTYRFRDDAHVFWKYTRGWKPGTYNATSSLAREWGGVQFPNISVPEPEKLDAFETGVRGSWLEGRLGLDFSLFYYAYENYQLFTAQQFSGGQPEFVIINAPSAEVYGAELDAVARPWSGAYLNLRLGWLESQFLDFVQIQQDEKFTSTLGWITVNREQNNNGHNLLNSPRLKVSLTAEQTLPLGRWGSVSARYDGVWTDTTYFDATEGHGIPNNDNKLWAPDDTFAQVPFWVHNLRLSYRPPGLRVEVAAWVRNLTNQVYKTFAFDGSTFNHTSLFFVGDPRTFGGSLVVNF